MTDFQVDHETLLALAARLQRIAGGLSDTADAVHGYADAVGCSDVSGALDSFVSNWSEGRQQISDDIKSCVGYLHGAGLSYRTTDAQVAEQFAGGG